jgi:threonine 3-dehydrogenase
MQERRRCMMAIKKMIGVQKSRPEYGAEYREDIPVPVPGSRDVLIKVEAAAICGTDQHIMDWTPYAQARIQTPMVFGHEFSGDIVEVGDAVTEYKPGDRVAGETHIPCNECYQCKTDNRHICNNMKIIGVHTPGAFAEYISIPADCVYKLNDDISYNDAAMLEPMGVGVHGVSVAKVRGENVAIFGAGPIGLFAVAAAKYWKAKKIIAVDVFDEKLKIAKEVGADVAVNSKDTDAVNAIIAEFGGVGADIVIDYTGNVNAIHSQFQSLRKGGKLVLVGLPSQDITLDLAENVIYKEATIVGVTGRLMYQTWEECVEILTSPDFDIKPIVGGIYPLKDYEKAFADIKSGKPGKMLLIP